MSSYHQDLKAIQLLFPNGFLDDKFKNDNSKKREIYASLEILKMDIESDKTYFETDEGKQIIDSINILTGLLKLRFSQSRGRGFAKYLTILLSEIDYVIRGLTVVCVLMSMSVIFCLPAILWRNVDYLLVKLKILSPEYQLTNIAKWFIARYFIELKFAIKKILIFKCFRTILCVSGIELVVEGLDKKSFGKCVMLTYRY